MLADVAGLGYYPGVDREANTAFHRVRWIHLGFAAFAVYLPLSFYLLRRPDPLLESDGAWPWLTRAVLAGLSVHALVAVQLVVRRRRGQRRTRTASVVRFPPSAEPAASNAVLRMLFSGAIGVYGLLLFILWGRSIDLFAFSGMSLAALAWHLPTRNRWEHELKIEREG